MDLRKYQAGDRYYLQKQEITDTDWPELLECMWDSYEHKLEHYFPIFCPLNPVGVEKPDRAAAIKECAVRFKYVHEHDPKSRWFKVVDKTNNNKIVAACWWTLHAGNSFQKLERTYDTFWHPEEGGQREFATDAFWLQNESRAKYAQRPHISIEAFFTLPAHQNKGIGKMMMQCAIDEAESPSDKLWGDNKPTVELWLEGGPVGKPFYEKRGFVLVEEVDLAARMKKINDPGEIVKDWQAKFQTRPCYVMWKPKTVDYVGGQLLVKPWE